MKEKQYIHFYKLYLKVYKSNYDFHVNLEYSHHQDYAKANEYKYSTNFNKQDLFTIKIVSQQCLLLYKGKNSLCKGIAHVYDAF